MGLANGVGVPSRSKSSMNHARNQTVYSGNAAKKYSLKQYSDNAQGGGFTSQSNEVSLDESSSNN